MTDRPLDVLAISGSLRKGSLNTALLRAAQALAPAGLRIEIGSIADLPPYDGDLEARDFPAAAQRLKQRVRQADALLFAVAEYNFSVSGVLKNAIDWGSRPYGQSAWAGKPAALVSAGGRLGAARAQYHFRQIAHGLDMRVLNRPEVFVADAAAKFDAAGQLADSAVAALLEQLLAGLAALARQPA